MAAFYNEIDPYAAQWLRNLIDAGHIPAGVVDERDIRDIRPSELAGYTQVHFFAGLGGWSHALRLAGWSDDEPVWTGSCPCQPFSAAGKGGGFADERHLWPAFFHLIDQCRPATILGEQVASKDGLAWLDLVQSNLEGAGYAVAAADICAAGIGAPHIRQRLWWVADADCRERGRVADGEGRGRDGQAAGRIEGYGQSAACGVAGILADADIGPRGQGRSVDGGWHSGGDAVARSGSGGDGLHGLLGDTGPAGLPPRERAAMVGAGRREQGRATEQSGGASGWHADSDGRHAGAEWQQRGGQQRQQPEDGSVVPSARPSPTNGFWRDADWLLCRDGKWRPVEPGTFPLASRIPNRVGQLRAYGNAIVPQVAAQFISAYREGR